VPIRKKIVRTKSQGNEEKTGRRGRGIKGSNISGNSPPSKSAFGAATETDIKTGTTRSMMIPLVEEREEDEEETAMRDMKDREAKRKREEEIRLAKKAQEEAEEAARLAQVKDQMKNKPYTYDSEGNIIWIQPVPTERLPNANPALTFGLKRGPQKESEEAAQKSGGKAGTRKTSSKKKGKKEPEFSDSFKKLTSQQPPMMDTMAMAPGVLLSERGRSKKGHGNTDKEKGKMTRRDYLQMVQSTGQNNTVDLGDGSMLSPLALDPQSARDADLVAASFDQDGGPADALGQNDAFNMAIVTSTDWGNNPGRASPGEPRPVQPAPPATVHNPKLKRDAVGYRQGARDRAPTSGTVGGGFTRPQPPLHATMGHGLLPKGSKHEEFYFPHSPAGAGGGGLANLSESEEEVASPEAARDPHGMIQTENKQLIQRLFR